MHQAVSLPRSVTLACRLRMWHGKYHDRNALLYTLRNSRAMGRDGRNPIQSTQMGRLTGFLCDRTLAREDKLISIAGCDFSYQVAFSVQGLDPKGVGLLPFKNSAS